MKILIPLDGSELSEKALAPAMQIAKENDAEVYLMRIAPPAPEPGIAPRVRSSDVVLDSGYTGRPVEDVQTPTTFEQYIDDKDVVEHLHDEAEQEMLQYLEERSYGFTDGSVKYEIGVGKDPAAQIVELAHFDGIDLIVMATHDRSGIGKLFKGSIADKVLESGVAPVVLVHHTGEIERIEAGTHS